MYKLEINYGNNKVKWIITFTALILIAISVIGIAVSLFIKDKKNDNSKETERVVESNIVLTSGPVMVHNADSTYKYVSQTITATLMPKRVIDEYVTWSIAWENSDCPLGEISNYLKITDDSQGNLIATLNCYKSFKGYKAILTCNARTGNKSARAEVVFEGVPSSFVLTTPSVPKYNLGKDEVDLLYVGSSYDLDISMSNIFNDVGENYYNEEDFFVSLTGVGTMVIGDYYVDIGERFAVYKNERTVDFSYILETPFAPVHVSISDGKLHIKVDIGLESFKRTSDYEGGNFEDGTAWKSCEYDKFKSLNTDSDGNLPYFKVTLKNTKCNFSTEYKFFIGTKVNNVSLSKTEIKF